jgi:hypothetical protein
MMVTRIKITIEENDTIVVGKGFEYYGELNADEMMHELMNVGRRLLMKLRPTKADDGTVIVPEDPEPQP